MTLRTSSTRLLRTLSVSSTRSLRTRTLPSVFCTKNHYSRTTTPRYLSATSPLKMASDEDYMAFLNKANQDTGSASTQQTGKVKTKAVDQGSEVPKAIKDACKDAFYVSEADEPFEEVSLKHEGKLPDEETFANLINLPNANEADISILDPSDWDSRGQYTNIIDAVREASRGNDVRVYKVVRDRSRVEYWVVTAEGKKLLGVKALAVES